MPAKKHVVVFDFDGVVADSFGLHIDCWKQALKGEGTTLSDEAVLKALGWSSLETAQVLVKEAGLKTFPEEIAKRKTGLFTERSRKELNIMPGADAAVARLAGEFHVALTSGRTSAIVGPALERFGLKDTFDLVITGDDMQPQDELDDLLAQVFERLKLKKGDGVMVDDSRNGLLAAERAGMKSVAFDSNPKLKVDYSMADAVIGSLDELQPELLHSVFG
ncbi:MAG TPA: HAD-IA family hydrolase [Patescibacteria group bacterium]|jgi:HAD superfamily hydrolase (TIGR01509 family)